MSTISSIGLKMDHQKLHKLTVESCKTIEAVDRRIDCWKSTSLHSLPKCKSTARHIAEYQGKIGELEGCFRKLDEIYLRTKAVQGTKHEEWVCNAELLSSTKSRTEDLKKMIHVLTKRRQEREEIISEQLTALAALEQTTTTDVRFKRGQQEAVTWYNRALGFRVECGHGIKFIFVNVDRACPDREFSFTIRHCRRTDCYTLLDCDPSFEGCKDLIEDLNKTNDLYKFVRVMRGKFEELSSKGHEKLGRQYAPDEISHQSHVHGFSEIS